MSQSALYRELLEDKEQELKALQEQQSAFEKEASEEYAKLKAQRDALAWALERALPFVTLDKVKAAAKAALKKAETP